MKNIENSDTGQVKKVRTKKGIMKRAKWIALIVIIAFILGAGTVIFLSDSNFTSRSKTTKIGFEDIGELDTQAAYCTIVDVTDDSKEIFGMEVPFTKSTCVYSYDVVVKAGLDFGKISWEEIGDKIVVNMPAVHITDSYIDENSGKIYHEKESIFSPITFEEQMLAREDLVEKGVTDAEEKGIFDNARANAENMMTSFFRQHDEYKDKEIVFEWETTLSE